VSVAAGIERKLVLVTRATRLQELVAKHQTAAQARFYVEHLGGEFGDYEREHAAYSEARRAVGEVLERHGRWQALDRRFLTNFLFAPDDIVLALGQDGLVANTMKYLDGQPLVGLNPEPARYDGILLPFGAGDLAKLLPDLLADRRPTRDVTMAKATLTDKQVLYAVNDLFIGPRTHTSARYEIHHGTFSEVQSSSGIIVSTGMGSTAWIRSVVTGSVAIAEGAFDQQLPPVPDQPAEWDAPCLFYAVREPFPSKTTGTNLVFGEIHEGDRLKLRSLMPENGVIFSDGIETDRLEFNAGTEAQVGIAERRGRLVV
jgi:NAD kinase